MSYVRTHPSGYPFVTYCFNGLIILSWKPYIESTWAPELASYQRIEADSHIGSSCTLSFDEVITIDCLACTITQTYLQTPPPLVECIDCGFIEIGCG